MNNVKNLKEGEIVLLTYKGSSYNYKIKKTSIIGIVKSIQKGTEGKDEITIEVIHDNAPEDYIVFEPGKIVNFEITKFKEYTSRIKGLTITKKKNPGYIELKIL